MCFLVWGAQFAGKGHVQQVVVGVGFTASALVAVECRWCAGGSDVGCGRSREYSGGGHSGPKGPRTQRIGLQAPSIMMLVVVRP